MIRRTLVVLAAAVALLVAAGTASAAGGWTTVSVPNPSSAGTSQFGGISCPTSTFCMAVGVATAGTTNKAIAETYNGKTWSVSHPPTIGKKTQLSAVDCPTATFCTAVGYGAAGPVAERWNGKSWRVEAPVGVRYGGGFAGVSCPTTTSCVAVGDAFVNQQEMGAVVLAERWQGPSRGWSVTSTPSLAPYEGASLSSVSCTSTTHCVAAGGKIRFLDGEGQYNLVETWSGTKWSVTAVPSPAGVSYLDAITCRSTTWCIAVGKTGSGSGKPATLTGEAGKWEARAVSVPKTSGGTFSSVACRSTTSCIAAGFAWPPIGTATDPLVEHWNGASWSGRAVSAPASQGTQLQGVSCASTSSCYAAGYYEPTTGGDNEKVLVEHGPAS
jgi:hypothetical protein